MTDSNEEIFQNHFDHKFVEIHFVFETRHNVRAVDVKDAVSMIKD